MGFIGDIIEFIIKFPFIVIGWIIIGAFAGELARRFTNSVDRNGFSDFILGIAGAIIGGLLASLFGLSSPMGGIVLIAFNLVIATVGAMILITVWRMATGNDGKVLD